MAFTLAPSTRADVPGASSPSADAMASAQALFVDGRRLVAEGRYAEGCAKLEQSQRLDPAPGTQVNLADCYEKSGKVASAWIAFHAAAVAAQLARRAEWAEQARERARILQPSVPELTVVVDEPVAGLEVRRGESWIESSVYGSPVPIDPGLYEIAAVAPGRRPWSTRVVVDAGAHVILHVPALAALAELPRSASPPAQRPSGRVQRTAALTLGGAAIVWAGVGAYLGLTAIFDNNEAGVRCPTPPVCTDQQAVTLTTSARRAADASTAAFVTGGALLATAAILYFTIPRGRGGTALTVGTGLSNVYIGALW